MKKSLDNMRDCVMKAFCEGCQRGDEFHKMRHAIIVELDRLGYESSEIKDELLKWNKKNERPYKGGDERRQLLGYVNWFYSLKEPKYSCRTLEDYCLGKKNCQFYKRTTLLKKQQIENLPFNLDGLKKFLTERYKPDG